MFLFVGGRLCDCRAKPCECSHKRQICAVNQYEAIKPVDTFLCCLFQHPQHKSLTRKIEEKYRNLMLTTLSILCWMRLKEPTLILKILKQDFVAVYLPFNLRTLTMSLHFSEHSSCALWSTGQSKELFFLDALKGPTQTPSLWCKFSHRTAYIA